MAPGICSAVEQSSKFVSEQMSTLWTYLIGCFFLVGNGEKENNRKTNGSQVRSPRPGDIKNLNQNEIWTLEHKLGQTFGFFLKKFAQKW
jgi:hypothetical protein